MISRLCLVACLAAVGLSAIIPPPSNEDKTQMVPEAPEIPMKCDDEYTYGVFGCNNTYYQCTHGKAVPKSCPSKMYFDISQIECRLRFQVNACTSAPTGAPIFEINKNELPECGDEEFVSQGDPCSRFYGHCSNGVAERKFCPYGQVWVQVDLTCDNIERVEACKLAKKKKIRGSKIQGAYSYNQQPQALPQDAKEVIINRPQPELPQQQVIIPPAAPQGSAYGSPGFHPQQPQQDTSVPVQVPNNGASIISKTEFDCTTKQDGIYLPDPNACTNTFYKCANSRSFKYMCPQNLWYDHEDDKCNYKPFVPTCGGVRPPPPPPEPVRDVPRTNFDCTTKPDDSVHVESECPTSWISCLGGIATLQTCPPNLVFDMRIGHCDYLTSCKAPLPAPKPQNDFAHGGSNPSGPYSKPVQTIPPSTFNCAGKLDGYYEMSKCSNSYITCNGGVATLVNCPSNLVFDSSLKQCDYAELCMRPKQQPQPQPQPQIPQTPSIPQTSGPYQYQRPAPLPQVQPQPQPLPQPLPQPVPQPQPRPSAYQPAPVPQTPPEPIWLPQPTYYQKPQQPRPQPIPQPLPQEPPQQPQYGYQKPQQPRPQPIPQPLPQEPPKQAPQYGYQKPQQPKPQPIPQPLPQEPPKQQMGPYGQPMTNSIIQQQQPQSSVNCANLQNGAYPVGKCSRDYVHCWNQVSTPATCPSALIFNAFNGQCDYSQNVPDCPNFQPPPQQDQPTVVQPPAPVDPFCERLADGTYANGCSNTYYVCQATKSLKMACPVGLFFDLEKNECHQKEIVPACGGKAPQPQIAQQQPIQSGPYGQPRQPLPQQPVPQQPLPQQPLPAQPQQPIQSVSYNKPQPQPMTPPQQPQPLPAQDSTQLPSCAGKPDGIYGLEGCTPQFYQCYRGHAKLNKCLDSLFYNVINGMCDFKERVSACGGSLPAPVPSTPLQPQPAQTASDQPTVSCQGKQDGYYALGCSSSYWGCVNGIPIQHQCNGNNLFFSMQTLRCDFKEWVPECGGKIPAPAPPAETLPAQSPPSQAVQSCMGKSDGLYALGACSTNYLSCFAGNGMIANCNQGLVFDETTQACNYDINVIACGKAPAQDQPLPQPQQPQQPQPQPRTPTFDCTGLQDGFWATTKCSETYALCQMGKVVVETSCPSGLAFSNSQQQCHHKENLIECNPQAIPLQPVQPAQPVPQPQPQPQIAQDIGSLCAGKLNGLYSMGCNSQYVMCTNMQSTSLFCPSSLVYDDTIKRCNYPNLVSSCQSAVPQQSQPMIQPLPQPLPQQQPLVQQPMIFPQQPQQQQPILSGPYGR